MRKSYKSYTELLKEEQRLEEEKQSVEKQLDELFTVDLSFNNIIATVRAKVFKRPNDESHKLTLTKQNDEQEQIINLAIDLLYQTITMALVGGAIHSKNSFKSNTANSFKLILKTVIDNIYNKNKNVAVTFISNFISKQISRIKDKSK